MLFFAIFGSSKSYNLSNVAKNVTVYPDQVVFIRHAEKNESYDPININAMGQARARELPRYFSKLVAHGMLKKQPDLLVAMKMKNRTTSNRPIESINPLSNALQRPLQFNYTQDQLPEVIQSVNNPSNTGKTVVICFEHNHLVPIAQGFGIPAQGWNIQGIGNATDSNEEFTILWLLSKNGNSSSSNFKTLHMFQMDKTNTPVYNPTTFTPIVNTNVA